MPRLVGFSRFAALPEEQIGEKISRRILSGAMGWPGSERWFREDTEVIDFFALRATAST